jgi:hypothetical protein
MLSCPCVGGKLKENKRIKYDFVSLRKKVTMSDVQLYNRIASLPEDLKKQVADFVEFLETKSHSKAEKKERKFGYAKGFFKMSEDFDEPLDDFKDYM